MRQKNDLEFAQLLNRMREGNQLVPQDTSKQIATKLK